MYVIKPTTRSNWTELLTNHQIEEDAAETLIDLIAGHPRVSGRRPMDRPELNAAVDAIDAVLDDIDLTEYGKITDGEAVQQQLVKTLRQDLGLLPASAAELTADLTPHGSEAAEVLGELTVASETDFAQDLDEDVKSVLDELELEVGEIGTDARSQRAGIEAADDVRKRYMRARAIAIIAEAGPERLAMTLVDELYRERGRASPGSTSAVRASEKRETEEPPEDIARYVEIFEKQLDDDSAFGMDDFERIVEWVRRRNRSE